MAMAAWVAALNLALVARALAVDGRFGAASAPSTAAAWRERRWLVSAGRRGVASAVNWGAARGERGGLTSCLG